jgi:hypothetical protein
MLFGINDDMPVLLGMIGLNIEYFDRFRDVDLIQDGTKIRVMTRLGGGNREGYKDTWKKIRQHELYCKDYDDDFDETYAYIEYKIPEKYQETARKMFKCEPISFHEKFEKELEDMSKPGTEASKRAEEIAKKFQDAINNDNGNVHFIKL